MVDLGCVSLAEDGGIVKEGKVFDGAGVDIVLVNVCRTVSAASLVHVFVRPRDIDKLSLANTAVLAETLLAWVSCHLPSEGSVPFGSSPSFRCETIVDAWDGKWPLLAS